jgi:WD40 repeat protein
MTPCHERRRFAVLGGLAMLLATMLGPRLTKAQTAELSPKGASLPPQALARLHSHHDTFFQGDAIPSLAFSPDGKVLAVMGGPAWSGLWQVATGQSHTFKPNARHLSSLAFSADGTKLVMGGAGLTLVDVQTGKDLVRFLPYSGFLNSLALSPDGRVLAGAGDDHTVILWDGVTGKFLHHMQGHQAYVVAVAFAPDGKTLATGSHDATLRLWDVATGKEQRCLTGHGDQVSALSFAPDGKTLASGSWDRTIRFWDVSTGKAMRLVEGHAYGVCTVAYAPDGQTLASGGLDGTLRLWHVASGRRLREVVVNPGGVRALAFAPDGQTVATAGAGNDLRLWDASTGEAVRSFAARTGKVNAVVMDQASVNAVAVSPDGQLVVTGNADTSIRLWDLATGQHLRRLGRQPDAVWSVAFAPDGKTVASVGRRDGVVHLWEVATGKDLRPFAKRHQGGVSRVVFSPDGKTLAGAGGSFDPTIYLWDVATGKSLRGLVGHNGFVSGAAFAPDSKTLVSAAFDATLRRWDLATGKELKTWPQQKQQGRQLSAVALAPDGNRLALGMGNVIDLLDARTGREVRKIQAGAAAGKSLAFSSDGRLLMTGGGQQVHVWEVATGLERCGFAGHQAAIACVALDATGRILVSGSQDGIALVWDVTGLRTQSSLPRLDDSEQQLQALWQALGGADGRAAHRAVWHLVAAPRLAVPFLKGQLRPPAVVKEADVRRLIADLDHARYAVRVRAGRALEELGDQAKAALTQALAGELSAETRRRVELLLQRLEPAMLMPERLRCLRGVEVLEHIANREAREALATLAQGPPTALLTEEAQRACLRLERRSAAAP